MVTGDSGMDHIDRCVAALHRRLTRIMLIWGLGQVWLTVLIAGAVIVLLWAR